MVLTTYTKRIFVTIMNKINFTNKHSTKLGNDLNSFKNNILTSKISKRLGGMTNEGRL